MEIDGEQMNADKVLVPNADYLQHVSGSDMVS